MQQPAPVEPAAQQKQSMLGGMSAQPAVERAFEASVAPLLRMMSQRGRGAENLRLMHERSRVLEAAA